VGTSQGMTITIFEESLLNEERGHASSSSSVFNKTTKKGSEIASSLLGQWIMTL